MIEVKDAIVAAMKAAKEYYKDQQLENLALEEVELSEDERYWHITLGFDVHQEEKNQDVKDLLETIGWQEPLRHVYKVFKVDSSTGKVLSMRIREV